MNRRHIALIYTGGTVGMTRTVQGYAPMQDFGAVLTALLDSHGTRLPRWTLHAYADPIDSANATPADWLRIASDIAARYRDYDGFVVLHGTDTMTYTAAALSFMLRGLRKPVIVTGSQIPLGAERTDAARNLITALQLAASEELSEAAIFFDRHLLRGNRATKISTERMAAFDSPSYPWLAEVGIDIAFNRAALLPRPEHEAFTLPAAFTATVLALRFMPGMPLTALQALLAVRPQGLILECYGAGNAPDRDPALLDMLAHASADGCVIVACSQCAHGSVAIGTYAAGAGLRAAGVVGAADMRFEAIYAKLHLMLALGMDADAIREQFTVSWSGEISG